MYFIAVIYLKGFVLTDKNENLKMTNFSSTVYNLLNGYMHRWIYMNIIKIFEFCQLVLVVDMSRYKIKP